MTLQAQQIHLCYAQKPRVSGTVRSMTTGAAFRLYRDVFIYERALRVCVALEANQPSPLGNVLTCLKVVVP